MKKVILFLSVIGATLLMTSCLGEGGNNYTDSSFVYLDMDERGQIYGKTFSRWSGYSRVITTNSMLTMDPGTFKFMVYSWDEANGTAPITVDGQSFQADIVQLADKVIDISQKSLNMGGIPVVEEPVGFDEILDPLYSNSKSFMRDYWIIEYGYSAKKGETGRVEFYKRDELNEKGEIVIEAHLTLTGTPDGTTVEKRGDAVALYMGQLRSLAEGSQDKKLKIRFAYYKNKGDNTEPELVELQNAVEWNISEEN
ncbi:putative secreted protein [Proteiniphilum saccharofermentans]|uniref:Putative secreted protein n=1 Tax=Proteiniphilum saccharofermentans TaxID=1642647 RepID=A0A1R3T381_9BACT|nr:hypothetical protein [Proteiniphilum saccharofermentans]SCD21610.1 putative secreted protein [Proteiniphilum saccharofermentans]